jgi:hypothetical protein
MTYFISWIKQKPYIHPHFFAMPYEAPEGCDDRQYQEGDQVSIACADPRYRFDIWKQYGLDFPGKMGWHDGKKTGTYYRIGNDLVGFSCTSFGCPVHAVEKNVFHQKLSRTMQ